MCNNWHIILMNPKICSRFTLVPSVILMLKYKSLLLSYCNSLLCSRWAPEKLFLHLDRFSRLVSLCDLSLLSFFSMIISLYNSSFLSLRLFKDVFNWFMSSFVARQHNVVSRSLLIFASKLSRKSFETPEMEDNCFDVDISSATHLETEH